MKKLSNTNRVLIIATFCMCLFFATVAVAQTGFVPLSGKDVTESPLFSGVFGATPSLTGFLNAVFKASLAIGGILAVLRIVYGGILYMTTDLPGSKTNAREVLSDAVIGLLLLLAIWIILYQINPDILSLNITGSETNYNPGVGTTPY